MLSALGKTETISRIHGEVAILLALTLGRYASYLYPLKVTWEVEEEVSCVISLLHLGLQTGNLSIE